MVFVIHLLLIELYNRDVATRFERQCSFDYFFAVDDTLLQFKEHWRHVTRALRWRTQVRYMKKGHLCQQQMTLVSVF